MSPRRSHNERDPTEAMRKLGLGFIGVFIALISLGIAGGVVSQWLSAGLTAASLVGAVLGICGFILAAWMVRHSMKKTVHIHSRDDLLDSSGARGILRVAKAQSGELTVGEAALECRLSTQDARDILDAFYLEGVCEQHMSGSGQEVYLFADFLENEHSAGEQILSDEDEVALQFDALLKEASLKEASLNENSFNESSHEEEEPAQEVAKQSHK